MLAVLGCLFIAAALGLLYFGRAANRRAQPARWTENRVVEGLVSPAIILLFGAGVVAWVFFLADLEARPLGWPDMFVLGSACVSTVLGWMVLRGR